MKQVPSNTKSYDKDSGRTKQKRKKKKKKKTKNKKKLKKNLQYEGSDGGGAFTGEN